jgi:hypothetical protein
MKVIYANPSQAHVETNAPVIAIKFLESGYFPIYTSATPKELNGPNVTDQIIESAVIGSMFGWQVPGSSLAVEYFTGL